MSSRGAVLLAALLALTACTTSGHPEAAPIVSTPAPTTPSATPTPTPTPASTSAAPSTSEATTSSAPSTSAPVPTSSSVAASTSAAAPQTTCTSVDVRVIRGSASLGQEIAALDFVNSGTRSCVLAGYPTATLLRNGRPIGQPSQPSSTKPSLRTLKPGDVAESLLHDYSSCQAPLSDSIRVTVPGTSMTAVRPAQLRACTLRLDRLGAAD